MWNKVKKGCSVRKGGDIVLLEKMQNVQLTGMDGNQVAISDFKGKNTLIFMWASW
jgi:cytochrome oxidase Cu insertion factor (SCO1/SenC/PrrC family)